MAVDDAGVCGAALWLPPEAHQEFRVRRLLYPLFLLPVLGRDIPRASGVQKAFDSVEPQTERWYLPAIGVDPTRQGKGVGSALLSKGLRQCDATQVSAYLVSTKRRNIPFYERHGFQVTGEHRLPAKGPKLWPMLRVPRSGGLRRPVARAATSPVRPAHRAAAST